MSKLPTPVHLDGHFLLRCDNGTADRLDLSAPMKDNKLELDEVVEVDFHSQIVGGRFDGWYFTGRLKKPVP